MKEYNLENLQEDYTRIEELQNKRDYKKQGWTREEELEYLEKYANLLTFECEPDEEKDISFYEKTELEYLIKRRDFVKNVEKEDNLTRSILELFKEHPMSYLKHSGCQDYICLEKNKTEIPEFLERSFSLCEARNYNCWDCAIHIAKLKFLGIIGEVKLNLLEKDFKDLLVEFEEKTGAFCGRPKQNYPRI